MADTTEIDLEQELLRYQMDESREALTQKIELLEEKVTETVQSATASVAEATASVMETVQNATASVSDTVDSVTTAVQGTVDSVRQSVEGTVDSVKDAFDISHQVNQHPWLMLAGAVAVGYFGKTLLQGPSRESSANAKRSPMNGVSNRVPQTVPNRNPSPLLAVTEEPINGFSSKESYSAGLHLNGSCTNNSAHQAASHASAPTWFEQMSQTFAPEITKLQHLAIGAVLGSVREMIVEASPDPLKKPLAEVIDGFTEKLGGKPVQGSLLSSNSNSQHSY